MTQPPTARLLIDPPIERWRVTPRRGRAAPVIATGHQPTLWHPGILAKDLAAHAFARHVGGQALHVVVDYDTVDPPALDLPVRHAEALSVTRLRLVNQAAAAGLPANAQPPVDARHAADRLNAAAAEPGCPPAIVPGLNALAEAYLACGGAPSLAAQTTAVLQQRKRSLVGDMPTVMASTLVTQRFIDRLLDDPVGCVRAYNRAALAHPGAGVRPLYAGRDVVEAPLWAQADGPRTPVFIDLGDSRRLQLFTQGQPLDLTGPEVLQRLRPRALSLSALMRSEHCDLFIHGIGGGVYDRVTEQWWGDWVSEPLAPMAVVSADLPLGLDAPVATPAEHERAVWLDHHLPFNVDRFTDTASDDEAALISEKRHLLAHMDDDRDKRRRSAAFKRIHAINAELRGRHPGLLASARQHADETALGVRNAALASRRDWCFALYPDDALRALQQRVRDSAGLGR